MTILYLLSLDRTAALVLWATVLQIGAFYVQRLHYETLTEWGTDVPTWRWLARVARALSLIAYLTAAYVWYRIGLVPAVVALFSMFFGPVAVSTLDVWFLRLPARPMAFVSIPLTGLSFFLMIRALLSLA